MSPRTLVTLSVLGVVGFITYGWMTRDAGLIVPPRPQPRPIHPDVTPPEAPAHPTEMGLAGAGSSSSAVWNDTAYAGLYDRDWAYASTRVVRAWFYLGKIDAVWVFLQRRATESDPWPETWTPIDLVTLFPGCGSFSIDDARVSVPFTDQIRLTGAVSGDVLEFNVWYQQVDLVFTDAAGVTPCARRGLTEIYPPVA